MTVEKIKAYIDLTRIQFFFVWPLLFLSGLFLSFFQYGGFDWLLVGKAATIALLGFEAGFVLNDYVDRDLDARDIEHDKLTNYWRTFGRKPLASRLIPAMNALILIVVLASVSAALVLTLPSPHSYWILIIMLYSYAVEVFYQIKRENKVSPSHN